MLTGESVQYRTRYASTTGVPSELTEAIRFCPKGKGPYTLICAGSLSCKPSGGFPGPKKTWKSTAATWCLLTRLLKHEGARRANRRSSKTKMFPFLPQFGRIRCRVSSTCGQDAGMVDIKLRISDGLPAARGRILHKVAALSRACIVSCK